MAEKKVENESAKGSKSSEDPKSTGAKKHPWKMALGILGMLVWVGASVIASQLAVGYLMIWIVGVETFNKPVVTAIFSALSYVVAMLLIILVPLLIARRKNGRKSTGGKREQLKKLGISSWPTWTDVGLAPVGFIIYAIAAGAIMALFSLFPWFDAGEAQDVGFNYYISGVDRVVAFVTLVVVAPVAEEIIFRGWLYGKLREKIVAEYSNTASMIVSILLVSVLFGLVHMQWNVGVNVFALSVVLCGLREITGTIYAGVLLHMLKNGVAFWLLYVMQIG